MPSNLLTVDTAFPDLSGKSYKEQIPILTNYLYMLLEQLRYTLANLGVSNFNEAELSGLSKTLTGPLTIRVENLEGTYSEIQQEVDSVTITVVDLSGQFSQVKQDVDGLQITTSGGTSFISGDKVKSGTIEGSVIECTLNSSQGESNGELRFLYNGQLVGRVQMDTYGNSDGTGEEGQYRVFFEALGNFVLKLISDSNLSVTSKNGSIYIGADGGRVNISGAEDPVIRSGGGQSFIFQDDGIYLNGQKITN